MSRCGYTVKITNLSPNATEKDLRDFLEFCGTIQYVEITRDNEYACVAYVTFRNPHAAETAVLLSGTTISEESVCITRCEHREGEHNLQKNSTWKIEDEGTSSNYLGEIEPCCYTVKITNLPSNVSEDDVDDFLQFCGAIQVIEIARGGKQSCAAYVTFKNAHAVETALLLSGSILLDHPVLLTRCEHYKSDPNLWKHSTWKIEDERSTSRKIPYAGEAVYVAKKLISKGYVLGRDTFSKAKAFDESHHLTATTAAKIEDFNRKIGLTDEVFASVEAARSANQKYGISDHTKSAASAAGKTAFFAANVVANSSYFSKGALWVSGVLSRASKVAGDLGNRGVGRVKNHS